MSGSGITQYVVTLRYQEKGLNDILKLTSALTGAGFTTAMTDGEGHLHELGINSFGITSAQPEDKIREQAESLGELALGRKPEVEIQTWQAFQQDNKKGK